MSYDRDYSQLTVIHPSTRSLLGYLSIPHVKSLLKSGAVTETDPVKKAMNRFKRGKGNVYVVITPDTTLEELEEFLNGEQEGGEKTGPREFAVVTDERRRFVLGVATREDLMNFASRRPD